MDYLERVLAGLKQQTLPKNRWELLLIDNGSNSPVAGTFDLAWHPGARAIREEELGLTPARLRGIREARSSLLVLDDDDGVLDEDYLEAALSISAKYSLLGAWGSGAIHPQFEHAPPDWTKEHWPRMAIRSIASEVWSNFRGYPDTIPCGVGMCVRMAVARKYHEEVVNSSLRRDLDRKGGLLASGGDDDLALTAFTLGLGNGLFPALKLTHLIPATRLQEDYLLRLVEGQSFSGVIVNALHSSGGMALPVRATTALLGRLRRRLTMLPRQRRFLEARLTGQQKALKELRDRAPHLLRGGRN